MHNTHLKYPKSSIDLLIELSELKNWKKINKELKLRDIYISQQDAYDILNPNQKTAQCGKEKEFKSFSVGYVFCSSTKNCACAKAQMIENITKSKNNYSEEEKNRILTRRKNTVKEKYGVDNVFQLQSIVDNNKEHNFSRSDSANKKREETNIARYGHSNPLSNIDIQNKAKNTYFENTGFENPLSNPDVQSAVKATMIKKYGKENPLQVSEILEKVKNTNISIYGVDNPSKNSDVKEKIKKKLIDYWYPQVSDRILDKFELLGNYNGAKYLNKFRCETCNNEFEYSLINGQMPICRKCVPYGSGLEKQVLSYIMEYTSEYITHDRKIIAPYEIDIAIPSMKIAIEVCGLYWHSEEKLGKRYHLDKLEKCNNAGYKLITIFEDEIVNNPEIVKNRLSHILGKSKKIGARKCKVVELNSTVTRNFLEKHHIQGFANSSYRFGLEYDGAIVAIMTFSKARFGVKNGYELVRYCSSDSIVGGASKLLSYFVKKYNPSDIVSYADRRWSEGNLYETLGFSSDGKTDPNYWYFKDGAKKRFNRMSFTKQKLVSSGFSENLTEKEIMKNSGWHRIYDCGSFRYILKY